MAEYNLGQLFIWVDSTYGLHPDMKSHSGGGICFCCGFVHCKSMKNKINTKRSTESELVDVSNYISYNIWIYLFMESQV